MKTAKINVNYINHSGGDLTVVNAARVSFNKQSEYESVTSKQIVTDWEGRLVETQLLEFKLSEKDAKLIRYLAKHNHKSPFNHCFISFRVKAPIFVARQLVKHEYLPWNEVSRRYVTDEPEFYIPEQWRKAAENVKQGSSDETVSYDAVPFVEVALTWYNAMLSKGVCPEQARMVLPQNTMTEWIWSGTLYAFAKMCKLRLDSHTQKETREVAELVEKELLKCFPVSYAALKEFM